MSNDLRHVRSGERFRYSASTHNAFVDAALAHRQGQHDQSVANSRTINQTGIVLVRNDSGSDRSRFDVLGITGVLINPTDNAQAFQNAPAFIADEPTIHHFGRFVVLQEPLKAGAIGKAVISGITPCQVRFDETNEDATRADIVATDMLALTPHSNGAAVVLWRAEASEDPYETSRWALVRVGNAASNGFLAELDGATLISGADWRWQYAWHECEMDGTEATALTGGRSGTTTENFAINIAEIGNDDACAAGVALGGSDYPAGFEPKSIIYCSNRFVWMETFIDKNGSMRYWFDRLNVHDGTCEGA